MSDVFPSPIPRRQPHNSILSLSPSPPWVSLPLELLGWKQKFSRSTRQLLSQALAWKSGGKWEGEGCWERGTSPRQAADVQWTTPVRHLWKEMGTNIRGLEAEVRILKLSLGSVGGGPLWGASLSWLEHPCPTDTGSIGQGEESGRRDSYHQRIRTRPLPLLPLLPGSSWIPWILCQSREARLLQIQHIEFLIVFWVGAQCQI